MIKPKKILWLEEEWDQYENKELLYLTEQSMIELMEGKIVYSENIKIVPPSTNELKWHQKPTRIY